jgi:hypothetical protein
MAKRDRTRRAQNKIAGSQEGTLIKVDSGALPEGPAEVYRARAYSVARSTLFSAEFEAVIEIIAIDRVYRAMVAGLGRRLRLAPPHSSHERHVIARGLPGA